MEIEIVVGIILALWLLILALVKTGRLDAEVHAILLIFRTGRGMDFISRIANAKRFWRAFGNLGVLIGILLMALVVYTIGFLLYSKYYIGVSVPGFQAVIPGVTIPFTYGVIGLITVLVVHELAHGVLALSEGIPLKSSGVVFLASIPIGAFVEPDEEELQSSPRMTKLRVYAMGSFGNILLFLLAFSVIFIFQGNFLGEARIEIVDVMKGSPSEGILESGMVIMGIDGKSIESLDDFQDATRGIKPGQEINITTNKGLYILTAAPRPEDADEGYIGILAQLTRPLKEGNSKYIYFALFWIAFLNQGIGLVNLAPLHFGIAATDGHYILKELISKFTSETDAERLTTFISTTTLLAVIFSIVNPFELLG
jgi:membrane-associated protease RseP (regulator of RpoE activity)